MRWMILAAVASLAAAAIIGHCGRSGAEPYRIEQIEIEFVKLCQEQVLLEVKAGRQGGVLDLEDRARYVEVLRNQEALADLYMRLMKEELTCLTIMRAITTGRTPGVSAKH